MTTTGLTLGKYAPLHKGHQYLIETALKEIDHLLVIIYDCPETSSIPLPVRAAWIRELYPTVEVLEAWDGPPDYGDTPEIKHLQETYILKLLAGRPVSHFFSSEFYGEHMSRALGAVNRQVDPQRQQVPISASQIREDPFVWRKYISRRVYRDLVGNIVFLGAPSTGKTSLAAAMAQTFNTVWMPEYGAEYWLAHQVDRRLSLDQLYEIGVEHLNREEELLIKARRYLFCDTNAITTYMFSLHYNERALPELAELARQAATRYDLTFLCEDDIPYANTWDRSGEAQRSIFQKQIRADLLARKIPYIPLRGTLNERVARVKQALEGFDKYRSPLEIVYQETHLNQ